MPTATRKRLKVKDFPKIKTVGRRRLVMRRPSNVTMSGAVFGGTTGAFIGGPVGAALGLVIGGVAGEAIERYFPSQQPGTSL